MSLYRDLWGTGREGLLKFISDVAVTGITKLEGPASQLEQVDASREGIAKAVEELFKAQDYVLRISYVCGRENGHIELCNEGGEVRFNKFVFRSGKEG